MQKIKVITDSTSYIPKEFVENNDISIVPLSYTFEGEDYKEGYPGEYDDFFNRLSNSNSFPTTSQPAVGDFLNEYKKALEKYDEILVITLSSKISGTYNSALLAKNMLENEKISVVDSLQSASNLRFLIEDSLKMIQNGMNRDEIVKYVEEKRNKMDVLLTVDSLEYLRRGGRLSGIQTILGSVLSIKPIIQLKNGELTLLERVRGKNRAINKIIERISKKVERISVCHILNKTEALNLKKILMEKFPKAKISIDEIGPIVGSHLGPKTIGICFY